MKTQNLASQAAASLEQWIDFSSKEHEKGLFSSMIKIIKKNAVHFALPANGRLLDDDLKGLQGELFRLPYREITVEYEMDGHASYRSAVVLAVEYNKKEDTLFYEKMGITEERVSINIDHVFEFVVIYQFTDYTWAPCPIAYVAATEWDYHFPETVGLMGGPIVLFPTILDLMGPHLYGKTRQEKKIELMKMAMPEVRSVYELCEALSCKNVHEEIAVRPREKTNAKRLKKGKLPIFETRVLSIEVPKDDRRKSTDQVHSDRSSPRQHLRRGHIRKLQSGFKVWVSPCVVGSRDAGVIEKSYKIKPAPTMPVSRP